LQRLGLAEEMTLTPLSADAVATLATAILEGTPPEALLSFLQDRAAGTPLYVTALIRGLREGGELLRTGDAWVVGSGSLSAVPPVVQDLVLDGLERLDAGERTVLELIAVAGDAASVDLPAIVPATRQAVIEAGRGRQFDFVPGDLLRLTFPATDTTWRSLGTSATSSTRPPTGDC
jgi:predicted ATPase